jgi:hypothetical protein
MIAEDPRVAHYRESYKMSVAMTDRQKVDCHHFKGYRPLLERALVNIDKVLCLKLFPAQEMPQPAPAA